MPVVMLRRVSFALILRERADASNEISQRVLLPAVARRKGMAQPTGQMAFFGVNRKIPPLSSNDTILKEHLY
jgi:hypothetical protein